MKPLLRPEILELAEYHLVQYPHTIKLNQNENPYELPMDIKREILERLASARWSRYPAFIPREQIDLVARHAGWVPDGTLLGNGSNDLLQLLFMAVLERGRSVVISQPTFTLYKLLARGLGAEVREVPMLKGFEFDVPGIIDAARQSDAAMIVLCSPNNPTGSLLGEADVVSVIESTTGVVVLDEAYMHFAPQSLRHLLAKYDRLVILQTFSKAMGAAGLRFGYALAAPSFARQLNKVKLPYSVNIFTLLGAEVLIRRWDMIKGWIAIIMQERERMFEALSGIRGLVPYRSSANFLLVELTGSAPGDVFRRLAERGILVRDVSSYPQLSQCLRITIGTPDENSALLTA
ncbi:MAG TPA: histidinol-phosphate transaminase, partial [Bacteroidota bacterium]|nr:histidinol-phosphate transaminase [Bacteroidota bacterium]